MGKKTGMDGGARHCGVGTKIGFGACFGVWTTSVLYFLTRNVWASVFALGVCLGVYVLRSWALLEEVMKLKGDVVELEKRMVYTRATISELSLMAGGYEAEMKRFRNQARLRRNRSLDAL